MLGPGRRLRVRLQGESPYLRYGDAVLPQLIIKETFGEFAAAPLNDGTLRVDGRWRRSSIGAGRVPILGRVTCHRRLFGQLRGALADLRSAGLGYLIDPGDYGGCYSARFVASSSGPRLSHHSWGIAIDINAAENAFGTKPDQDPRIVRIFERARVHLGGPLADPGRYAFRMDQLPVTTRAGETALGSAPCSSPCAIHPDRGWEKVEDLSTLSELREQSGNLIWLEADSADLTDDDVALLAEEFGLHPLAVEDAIKPRQRPKIDDYDQHLFLVVHQLDPRRRPARTGPVGDLRRQAGGADDPSRRRTERSRQRRSGGVRNRQLLGDNPAALLHTLLDVIVDEYQEEADRLERRTRGIGGHRAQRARRSDATTALLAEAEDRRGSGATRFPSRGSWSHCCRSGESYDFFKGETEAHFRDVLDHTLRIGDQVRSVDDLSQAVLDLLRGEQSEALGVQGRKLSAWAAIFAVGTLIAGIYGMNFELVPEEGSLFGFWFAVSLTLVISVCLFAYFKRKKWL